MDVPCRMLVSLAATLIATAAGTCQNPVPTRVRIEKYGAASGTPLPVRLGIDLDATGPEAMLVVSQGIAGRHGVLVLGTQPAAEPLPYGAQLLVQPIVAVPLLFGATGTSAVPIDVAESTFVGQTLFAQGLLWVLNPGVETFWLTEGLRTQFHAGNAQPPLEPRDPPLAATLLVHESPVLDPRYEVLAMIAAPTSGWTFDLVGTSTEEGVTTVWLALEAPNPDEPVLPVVTHLRVLADLGFAAAPRIELMVERKVRGYPTPPVFGLEAVIERDF